MVAVNLFVYIYIFALPQYFENCTIYITLMFCNITMNNVCNLDCIIIHVCAHMNTMSGSVHVVYSNDSPLSKHYVHIRTR